MAGSIRMYYNDFIVSVQSFKNPFYFLIQVHAVFVTWVCYMIVQDFTCTLNTFYMRRDSFQMILFVGCT